MDAASDENVFGLSESQIAWRVKAAARATDLSRLGALQRPQRVGTAQRMVTPHEMSGSRAQLLPPALLAIMYISLGGGRRNLRFRSAPAQSQPPQARLSERPDAVMRRNTRAERLRWRLRRSF